MRYLDSAGLDRVWSKVEQRFSAKQDKLEGVPGQIVGFDTTGAAVTRCGWSNPNLLDNWYLADPVNQKGAASYTADGYTIDRWRASHVEVSIKDTCIELSKASVGYVGNLFQRIENAGMLAGKTVTLSALVSGDVNMVLGCDGGYPLGVEHSGGAVEVISCMFTFPQSVSSCDVFLQVEKEHAVGKVYAAKFEFGSVQTLAHQDEDGRWVLDDPPPNKEIELAKCQRFMVVYDSVQDHTIMSTGVTNAAASALYCPIFLPAPMRARPTVKYNDIELMGIYNGHDYIAAGVGIHNVDSSISGAKFILLRLATKGLGLTSFAPYQLNLKSGAQLIFDANL